MSDEEQQQDVRNNTYRAEFPLYSDYDRLFFLLKKADDLCMEINNFEMGKAREYYSVLAAIYLNMKAILEDTEKKLALDRQFVEMEKKTFEIMRLVSLGELESITDYQTLKDLIALHEELLQLKQFCGLGIMIRRNPTGISKLKKVLS